MNVQALTHGAHVQWHAGVPGGDALALTAKNRVQSCEGLGDMDPVGFGIYAVKYLRYSKVIIGVIR